ncbi:hypothetical protein [Candidatus Nitronereus thalassa]|uniref:Sel1 repeat family protein n=1 Tax=Candidatus Nitronereus thalassa TaxID=3020898 RepID=A0ABU3KD45_9BACT|nr:hypothetical protein [Candidatus Nitronereus thalassa]MDT7044298.1 hypothetical protein [Candidatus Nitronereus thalassa]
MQRVRRVILFSFYLFLFGFGAIGEAQSNGQENKLEIPSSNLEANFGEGDERKAVKIKGTNDSQNSLQSEKKAAGSTGVPETESPSITALLKAAEEGNSIAQFELGSRFLQGKDVGQDISKAAKWFNKAAIQGEAKAQYLLGFLHERGEGVSQSYKEAARWYTMAADQGLPAGQFFLGLLYEYGKGVPKSLQEAAGLYHLAAKQGIGLAQVQLGNFYIKGMGVSRDFMKAEKWYRLAAEQGNPDGQVALGKMYREGKGVPQDSIEAVRRYRQAANQGNPDGQFFMGDAYFNEKGVQRRYRQAANQGNPDGQFFMGDAYFNEKGVQKDLDEARKWFKLAANQGHGMAKIFSQITENSKKEPHRPMPDPEECSIRPVERLKENSQMPLRNAIESIDEKLGSKRRNYQNIVEEIRRFDFELEEISKEHKRLMERGTLAKTQEEKDAVLADFEVIKNRQAENRKRLLALRDQTKKSLLEIQNLNQKKTKILALIEKNQITWNEKAFTKKRPKTYVAILNDIPSKEYRNVFEMIVGYASELVKDWPYRFKEGLVENKILSNDVYEKLNGNLVAIWQTQGLEFAKTSKLAGFYSPIVVSDQEITLPEKYFGYWLANARSTAAVKGNMVISGNCIEFEKSGKRNYIVRLQEDDAFILELNKELYGDKFLRIGPKKYKLIGADILRLTFFSEDFLTPQALEISEDWDVYKVGSKDSYTR